MLSVLEGTNSWQTIKFDISAGRATNIDGIESDGDIGAYRRMIVECQNENEEASYWAMIKNLYIQYDAGYSLPVNEITV